MRAFVEYVEASISRLPIGADLRFETDCTLAPLILAVVSTEGPVHFELIVERLRLRYRLSRVREEARTTIRLALDKLENKGVCSRERTTSTTLPGKRFAPGGPVEPPAGMSRTFRWRSFRPARWLFLG